MDQNHIPRSILKNLNFLDLFSKVGIFGRKLAIYINHNCNDSGSGPQNTKYHLEMKSEKSYTSKGGLNIVTVIQSAITHIQGVSYVSERFQEVLVRSWIDSEFFFFNKNQNNNNNKESESGSQGCAAQRTATKKWINVCINLHTQCLVASAAPEM